MTERALIYNGSTKKIYRDEKDSQIVLEFKDAQTVFDGEKRAKFKNKGLLQKEICRTIFEFLSGYNIPNHYIGDASDAGLWVKKLEMIPIYVTIRNIAAGSFSKRFNLTPGSELKYPVIEYYLKDGEQKDMFIAESHAYAFGITTPEEMKHIARLASKVNAVLKSFMDRRSIKLVDYTLEFGRKGNQIFLADEITPDTARLWQISADRRLDPNYFRFGNSKAAEAYHEIHNRILGK